MKQNKTGRTEWESGELSGELMELNTVERAMRQKQTQEQNKKRCERQARMVYANNINRNIHPSEDEPAGTQWNEPMTRNNPSVKTTVFSEAFPLNQFSGEMNPWPRITPRLRPFLFYGGLGFHCNCKTRLRQDCKQGEINKPARLPLLKPSKRIDIFSPPPRKF